jgi:glutathione peroxidase-family protein
LKGESLISSKYKGKKSVVLMLLQNAVIHRNTPIGRNFTKSTAIIVLGFPANIYGTRAGSNEEIASFVRKIMAFRSLIS